MRKWIIGVLGMAAVAACVVFFSEDSLKPVVTAKVLSVITNANGICVAQVELTNTGGRLMFFGGYGLKKAVRTYSGEFMTYTFRWYGRPGKALPEFSRATLEATWPLKEQPDIIEIQLSEYRASDRWVSSLPRPLRRLLGGERETIVALAPVRGGIEVE